MRNDERRLVAISYHRNGVGGQGFHIALFRWKDPDKRTPRLMQAIAFSSEEHDSDPFEGQLAVTDTAESAAGNIEFTKGNSWRGHDHFGDDMRRWIAEYRETMDQQLAEFANQKEATQ